MPFNLEALLRENIRNLIPYSSARDEFKGEATVLLDANENSYGSPSSTAYNRYPDPLQWTLKQKISNIKGVPIENIFLGNGSDEAIDILIRAFCYPGEDNILIVPPTYGMYEVSANINDITIKKVTLKPDFQLNLEAIAEAVDNKTKLIFICSPNNPTGNTIRREDIETILVNFDGLVIIDEAYINYSKQRSFIQELTEYPNLVVLQTLSKAWGLAALRIGMAFASKPIITICNKIKPPYNINQASQEIALKALENLHTVNEWIKETVQEREALRIELIKLPFVQLIYPSDANFLLIKVDQSDMLYNYLVAEGVIVRNRSNTPLCEGCLRITVGTAEENKQLLKKLSKFITK